MPENVKVKTTCSNCNTVLNKVMPGCVVWLLVRWSYGISGILAVSCCLVDYLHAIGLLC